MGVKMSGGLPPLAGGRLRRAIPDQQEAGLGSGKAPLRRGSKSEALASERCQARQRQRKAARTARVPAAPGTRGSSATSCRRLCSAAPGASRCLVRLTGHAASGPTQEANTFPVMTKPT